MRINKILQLLKTRGPLSSKDIAEQLSITSEGARLQLVKLSGQGLLKAATISKGVGRPAQVYELTEMAQALFPNNHAALTVEILSTVKEKLGQNALDLVINSWAEENTRRYRRELADITDFRSRIEAYIKLRAKDGYISEYEQRGADFLLYENHCPISNAACSHFGLCDADLQILKDTMGNDVQVECIDLQIFGKRRCAFLLKAKNQAKVK